MHVLCYYFVPILVILVGGCGYGHYSGIYGYYWRWKEKKSELAVLSLLSKLNLEYIQESVHRNVIKTGSYHPPSCNVLKMTSLLTHLQDNSFNLGDTMSELILLTLCLCSQYCIYLRKSSFEGFRSEFSHNVQGINSCFGKLAEVVQVYEYGFEMALKPKSSLQYLIMMFQWHILLCIHQRGLQHEVIERLLTKVRFWERAKVNSYSILNDPTTTSGLLRFKHVMKSSNCLFAPTSRIWSSLEYNNQKVLEENVVEAVPHLAKFLRVSKYEHLDGFVFAISDVRFGSTVEALGDTVRRVLTCLANNDPSLPLTNCMNQDLEQPNWQFKFCGEGIFVTSFGPCYPTTHPRFAYGVPYVFILFQPDFSFGFHDIPSPKDDSPHNIRQKTRRNFAKNGRPYFRPPTKVYPVAPLYAKHLDNFDPNAVLKWWHNNTKSGLT